MGRSPSSDETNGVKKGPWSPEEDQILVDYIQKHGHGSWRAFPKLAGLNRCGKSCRLRWTNYLRPDIKRGKFSPEEEQKILNLHSILGNKWSAIATHLPGRTDNEIKNFWNTHLKKKLIQMGFDPMTHRPRTDVFAALPGLLALANLCDLVERRPWDDHSLNLHSSESALQSAKIQYLQHILLQSTTNVAHQSPTLDPTSIDPTLQQGSLNFINTMPHLDLDFGSTELMNNNPVLDDFEQQVIMPTRYDTNQDSSSLNAFFCQGENSNSSNSLLLEGLPPLTEASMGPTEDVCSNMSSFWAPELLLDNPFMTDFV